MERNNTTIEVPKPVAEKIRKLHQKHYPRMKSREFVELLADVFAAATPNIRTAAATALFERQLKVALSKK